MCIEKTAASKPKWSWFVVAAVMCGQTGCYQLVGWDESADGPARSCETVTLECLNHECDCCDSEIVPVRTSGDGDKGVRLDVYEVTVGRFKAFLDAPDGFGQGAESVRSALRACDGSTFDRGDGFPINCVTFSDADAFCKWDGWGKGRLPTIGEFKRAAGENDREFPWGADLDSRRATFKVLNALPVGSKPDGQGEFAHLDLVGNVKEWTATSVSGLIQVYGGSFRGTESELAKDFRKPTLSETDRNDETGFRCARNP